VQESFPSLLSRVKAVPLLNTIGWLTVVAEAAIRFADNVKYGSIWVAGLAVIAAILVYQATPSERFGSPVVSVSLVLGAIILVLAAHLWSMIFRLQARLLEIAIDSAVNSSPLLSNSQRVRLLSLTANTDARESEQARAA
jgi:hypothetical protein